MKVIVTAESLGKSFDDAHWSLWEDSDKTALTVAEQIEGWKTKFGVNISGGHFTNPTSKGQHVWNTKDALLEFASEEDYVLFKLEWS